MSNEIYGYVGRRGSGKTLYMTYNLHKEYLKGKKIITNYHTTFSEFMPINEILKFDSRLDDVCLGIDEIHLLADARDFSTKSNKHFGKIVTQLRKKGISFSYATQIYDTVEKRIRNQTDFIIICEELRKNTFKFRLFDWYDKQEKNKVIKTFDESTYKLYDTNEVIELIDMDEFENSIS